MKINEKGGGTEQELIHVESIETFHPGCGGAITSCPAPFGSHAIISLQLETKKIIEIVVERAEVDRLIRTLQMLQESFPKGKSAATIFRNTDGGEIL